MVYFLLSILYLPEFTRLGWINSMDYDFDLKNMWFISFANGGPMVNVHKGNNPWIWCNWLLWIRAITADKAIAMHAIPQRCHLIHNPQRFKLNHCISEKPVWIHFNAEYFYETKQWKMLNMILDNPFKRYDFSKPDFIKFCERPPFWSVRRVYHGRHCGNWRTMSWYAQHPHFVIVHRFMQKFY